MIFHHSFDHISAKPAITYMQTVDKRDADTLLPIIQSVVQPGTIIHSDQWRAYYRIQEKLHLNINSLDSFWTILVALKWTVLPLSTLGLKTAVTVYTGYCSAMWAHKLLAWFVPYHQTPPHSTTTRWPGCHRTDRRVSFATRQNTTEVVGPARNSGLARNHGWFCSWIFINQIASFMTSAKKRWTIFGRGW
jgi:hypothetical protein